MPYKSLAQAAYFNIHKKKMEKEGVDVDEWNKASKGLSLPEHTPKKKVMLKIKRKKVRIIKIIKVFLFN